MDITAQLSALTSALRPAAAGPLAGLKPGQVIQAQVLGPSAGGATRLAVGAQIVELVLPGRPPTGTSVQLQVQLDGPGPRVRVLEQPAVQAPRAEPPVTARRATALALQNVPPGPGRAAVAEMMQVALGRQDSMATLFASLAHLDGKLAALPRGVEPASLQALAAVLNLNGRSPTGQSLKTAVQGSGLFLEAMLAKGGPAAALQGDLKAALLALSRALKPWTDARPPVQRPDRPRPAPPSRDSLPRAQRSDAPVLSNAASTQEAGRALGTQIEAALARLRLSQLASLPQSSGQSGAGGEAAPGEWTFELPLLFGEEMGIAQFRVQRDGGSDGSDAERAWQMRFAIDFDATGGVHAKVMLRQGKIAVALWAEREGTAEALGNLLPELGAALESRGLCVGGMTCRHGAPKEPAKPAGAFMDRQT